jgi:hypothetical protein
MKLKRLISLFIFTGLVLAWVLSPTLTAWADGTWQPVGTAGFSAGQAINLSLALDSNNTPYVAYSDDANGDKATVMELNGSAWANVGAAGFSAGKAYDPRLALSSNNTPYVAYVDNAHGNKATVMKFNGAAWVSVGSIAFSASPAYSLCLALDSSNTPYVAYRDSNNSFKATVMKYTGAGSTGWVSVGPAGFAPGEFLDLSLAVDNNNTPYLAYVDGGNASKATVMKYNGITWVPVGSAGFSTTVAVNLSLVLGGGVTPFVTYEDHFSISSNPPEVMEYTGAGATGWVSLGAADLSAKQVEISVFAVDKGNTPYLAGTYLDPDTGTTAAVMKFNGAAWETVGSIGLDVLNDTIADLALDSNSVPYLAYQDGEHSNKATVIRYFPAPQVTTNAATGVATNSAILHGTVNALNVSTAVTFEYGLTNAYGSSITANPGTLTGGSNTAVSAAPTGLWPNTTYHFRVVGTSTGGATNGSDMTFTTLPAWGQIVGTAGFSTGQADNIHLALDKNNTPYVAYEDEGHGNKATVMKYTGSAWVLVGQAGFSSGDASPFLALDSSNTPYVAYSDGANGGKATVMKYTGTGTTGWQTVGPAGFTSDPVSIAGLAIDKNNTPYITITILNASENIEGTVWKYTGPGWDLVGSTSFQPIFNICLALDGNNTPYVAYTTFNPNNYYVAKYTGTGLTGWADVGTAAPTAGPVSLISLAMDQSNIPYVATTDYHTDKITVVKYTGTGTTGWATVGSAGFSSGSASSLRLALDKNNTPYVAYSDGDRSGKATVMKYPGAAWVLVGSEGLSESAASPDLALDSNNTPYIAYQDADNGNKATVLKLVSPRLALDKASPANAATGVATNPTLSWGVSNVTASYEYCYDTSGNNACDTGWISAGANTSVSLTGLKKGTTYYWQVRAVNTNGTAYADSNTWWSFSTEASTTSNSKVYLPFLER